MANEKRMLTPPEVAKRWGVAPDKVLALIHSGQLRAINLAVSAKGRARYRLHISDVEKFEEGRASKPPIAKPTRRRRRQPATAGKEYF